MAEPDRIPVNIAAQVVAAGIYGKNARITLALVPVFDKDGRYNLVDWPKEVENRFLGDAHHGDKGVECTSYEFHVIPLGPRKSWRSDVFTIHNKIEKARLKRLGTPDDVDKLNAYWRKVMGGAKEEEKLKPTEVEGFRYLGQALDPKFASPLRDPLEDEGRPPERPFGKAREGFRGRVGSDSSLGCGPSRAVAGWPRSRGRRSGTGLT